MQLLGGLGLPTLGWVLGFWSQMAIRFGVSQFEDNQCRNAEMQKDVEMSIGDLKRQSILEFSEGIERVSKAHRSLIAQILLLAKERQREGVSEGS